MLLELENGTRIVDFEVEDAGRLFGIMDDDRTKEFLPDRFDGEGEMREVLAWLVSNYGKPDFVRLTYKIEGDGGLLGWVSVGPLPSDESKREIAYCVDPAHWGRGYAAAAVKAFAREALDAGLAPELYAEVDERNARSIRVLEKSGFARLGSASGEAGLGKRLYRMVPAQCRPSISS
ncbi:MAG: GNAT family N-acetyltransferase [Spirochaetes bacterium]|nr:GNAT family N-acetyltransferase [Spirochaetota bacterium]MBU1081965.1 GNAT family N-acetyltransferase [Spirochaetota bacterium]